jgi:hypothetical protein
LAPVAIVTITWRSRKRFRLPPAGRVCTRGFTLTTQRDSVEIRAGRRFDYGEQVAGLDLAPAVPAVLEVVENVVLGHDWLPSQS